MASAGVTAWSRCNSGDAREQRGNDDDGEAFPASDRGRGCVSEVRTVEDYTSVPKWRRGMLCNGVNLARDLTVAGD